MALDHELLADPWSCRRGPGHGGRRNGCVRHPVVCEIRVKGGQRRKGSDDDMAGLQGGI